MSTSSDSGNRVVVGRIVGAHGIKGVLRVHPLTDFPERFLEMEELILERAGKPHRTFRVTDVSSHEGKGQFLFTVEGIDDRDAAESYRGWTVTVAPDERVELPEGEYWIDSLIGLDVVEAEGGAHLGRIEDVMPTGANDVYRVRTPEGEVKLVPAIADVVREIDIEQGVVRIAMMEGLWD